jgi:hypothetical protein
VKKQSKWTNLDGKLCKLFVLFDVPVVFAVTKVLKKITIIYHQICIQGLKHESRCCKSGGGCRRGRGFRRKVFISRKEE